MSPQQSPDQTTMLRLRRAIGSIGLGLPLVLFFGAMLTGVPMENSISEFFYTPLREVFIAAAAGVGMFLLAYEGYPPENGEWLTDRRVSGVAGASVLVMAAIPTLCHQDECYPPATLFDQLIRNDTLQSTLHLLAAGLFLLSLAAMSTSLFTRCTCPPCTPQKDRRNLCYRVFGTVIYAVVAVIGVLKFGLTDLGHYLDQNWHFTFWAESLALWSFGLSWLLKGEALHDRLPFFFEPPAQKPTPQDSANPSTEEP